MKEKHKKMDNYIYIDSNGSKYAKHGRRSVIARHSYKQERRAILGRQGCARPKLCSKKERKKKKEREKEGKERDKGDEEARNKA